MAAIRYINRDFASKSTSFGLSNNIVIDRGKIKERPADYTTKDKEHDRLRADDPITKAKINIETALNTPGYAYRGMKGDPDFNFFEYLRVAKIPYYLGGLGLAAVAMCGKNPMIPHDCMANNAFVKKVLLGVLMYYAAREAANAAINIPVKLFRGIDLNRGYRKITSLREGNPLNLPNNKKPSNQGSFESCEFTRWDLFYKYESGKSTNETFDKLAKKFGADKPLNDADSTIISKVKKMIIMANSWKTALSIPFIVTGLGLAQQKSFETADFREFLKDTINIFKPSTEKRFRMWKSSFKENLAIPIGRAFKDLWQGTSLTSKILGRTALIGAIGLSVLANVMILRKTSLDDTKIEGGKK